MNVQSRGFAASKVIIVNDARAAIHGLEKMSADLSGEVRIGVEYEDDEIVFRMNGRGQLMVHGRLVADDGSRQRLEFEFQTDQTALVPFVRELEGFLKVAG